MKSWKNTLTAELIWLAGAATQTWRLPRATNTLAPPLNTMMYWYNTPVLLDKNWTVDVFYVNIIRELQTFKKQSSFLAHPVHCEPKKHLNVFDIIIFYKKRPILIKFIHTILSKFFAQNNVNVVPHLNNISTLPCETSRFANEQHIKIIFTTFMGWNVYFGKPMQQLLQISKICWVSLFQH